MGGDFFDRKLAPSLKNIGNIDDESNLRGRNLPAAPEMPKEVTYNKELGVFSFNGINYLSEEAALEAASIEERVWSIHSILPINIDSDPSGIGNPATQCIQHDLLKVEEFFAEINSLLGDLNNSREREFWYQRFCENPRCGGNYANIFPISVDDLLERAKFISKDGVEVLTT